MVGWVGRESALSNLILIEEHVRDSALDFINSVTVGTGQVSLNNLSFDEQQVQLLSKAFIIKHLWLQLIWDFNAPIQL